MSELRERRKRTNVSDLDNEEKLAKREETEKSRSENDSRNVKKVEPDLRWIERLKSDLLSSGEKKKSETRDRVGLEPGSYWLTRILFLRFISFIYLIAFLVSYNQNKELIGNRGLTSARNFLLNGRI